MGRASRRSRSVVIALSAVAYLLLYAPILTVVSLSFASRETGFTLEWYAKLLQDSQMLEALERSLVIAALASAVATVLGTSGAIALERGHFPGRRILDVLSLLPLAMPELVLGIASLIWFATLRMTLGMHSIVLAHVTFSVSYVLVAVRASLRGLDPALIDAARDLGAGRFAVFRRVLLPLVLPGILAGALMAFTLSFDDFLISFFTAGVGGDTLPMKLYSRIRFGLGRELYALSALLVLLSTACAVVVSRTSRR